MGLRHIADAPRALGDWKIRERLSLKQHTTALRLQEANQRLQKRGLSAPIGAEQARTSPDFTPSEHLPQRVGRDSRRRDFRCDDGIASRHDQLFRARISSRMKNGVPITAVRMPSGISTVAAVRASVSITSR